MSLNCTARCASTRGNLRVGGAYRVKYVRDRIEVWAMTISGKVKNGVVVPDEQVELPEGAAVVIQFAGEGSVDEWCWRDSDLGPFRCGMRALAGSCDGLPADMALNHDHYLYGAPQSI